MKRASAAAGSAVFFVAAPTMVAGVVPAALTRWRLAGPIGHLWPLRVVGGGLVAVAVAVLLAAFASFVLEGRGTPAPIAPTEELVVGGLYRWVRNPMYLAVVAIIAGQGLLLGQAVLTGYAAVVWIIVAAFVHWYEEPVLARRYGAAYDAYRDAVPAWRPRLHPIARGRIGER